MRPTVSVIVASYNFGRYIAGALESVRQQTLTDFEAIIVDDGSTDESLAAIGPFLDDDRFSLIRQRHGGQARAKNSGLKRARGRFIAFLDADDVWLPDKLERQWKRIRSKPEVGVVFSRRALVDAEGRPLPGVNGVPPRGVILDEMFRQNFICFSSAMVRAKVVEHVGRFDERLSLAIDYDFWLRVARHYLFDCVDEPLTVYRVGHANLSRRQYERLQVARLIMQRFRQHYGGAANLNPRAVAHAESETLAHLSVISRGYSRMAAIGWALRALRAEPLHGLAWRGLVAALLPEPLRRLVRRLRGGDDSWERQCFTSSNRPEPIL